MKLDRLGDITSELSSNLVKSIVLPGGLLEWLSRPLPERLRDRFRQGAGAVRSTEAAETQRVSVAAGPAVLMGGLPVPDEAVVAMIHLAGGRSAKFAVVPVAASNQQEAIDSGMKLFTRFGMRGLQVLELVTRERAESPEWASRLAEFDAVFLVGDDEALGASVLAGTLAARTLKEMMAVGKPVAGLAAGAAIMGDKVMIERDGQEVVVEGAGLVPGLMLDTQFTQRSRFGRLTRGLNGQKSTALMAAGIDAGAALAVRDGEAKVLGEASVTFLDPRESVSLVPEAAATPPGALCELKVHVLMDGFTMNLRSRRPAGPVRDNPPPHAVGER